MNLNKQEIDKFYVSEHDQFLHKFDKEHPAKSASQIREIEKHQAIFAQRDGKDKAKPASILKRFFRVFYR